MKPPWFKEYEEFGIPKTLEPYPEKPVHNFLDLVAGENEDMELVQPGIKMKYPEVKEHVDRLATALRERGVEKGDRVGRFFQPPYNSSWPTTQSPKREGSISLTISWNLKIT